MMKKNQAVLRRVQKYRDRKGLKIVDTDSAFYKGSKFLYIIGFIWYAAIQFLFICGQLLVLSDTQKSELVYMTQFYVICAAVAVSIAGFALLLCKKHIVGGIFNLVSLAVVTYQYYVLLVLKNSDIDSMSKFSWRHLVPAVIMLVSAMVMCAIAIRAESLLKRDYTRVLEALYITYHDRLGSGSEEEWEALLSELDDNALEQEMDKQHTKEYKRKAAKKEPKTEDITDEAAHESSEE